ncbi:MAG: FG-GAP repeat protein, partial [Haliscomenobacter sp.]|nr:FG-GAP repeat protein [Haliscomenobacter sp.]
MKKWCLPSPDDEGHFGNAVAISGIYAVVGAPGEDSEDGQAYIFKRLGLNDWALDEAIVSDDVSTDDHFGDAVAISGKVVLVGALDDNIEGTLDAGSAYFFELQCDDSWAQTQKVTASDFNLLNYFGTSVGISGQHALVGAPLASIPGGLIAGAAYFFSTETLCEVVDKYTGTAPYDTRMDFAGVTPSSPYNGEVCSGTEIEVDVFLANPDGWGVEGTDYRFEVVSVNYNGATGGVDYQNGDVVSEIKETLTNNTASPITVTYNLAIRQLDCGQPVGDLCGYRSFYIVVLPNPVSAIELIGDENPAKEMARRSK